MPPSLLEAPLPLQTRSPRLPPRGQCFSGDGLDVTNLDPGFVFPSRWGLSAGGTSLRNLFQD